MSSYEDGPRVPEVRAEPEVEKFQLSIRVGGTISVIDPATGQTTDWLKLGTEVSATWNGVPSEDEVVLRYGAMTVVGNSVLEDLICKSRERLEQARRGE